jgi:hypothetical protein
VPAAVPVAEQRGTVHHDLDPAADALRDPDQGADSAGIGRGPVVVRPAPTARDRADGQEVLHGHPPRGGLPGGFQHHRPRQVPALLRDLGVGRAEPERPGGPVEQRPEHARGIGPRQAQPLHGAVRRNGNPTLNPFINPDGEKDLYNSRQPADDVANYLGPWSKVLEKAGYPPEEAEAAALQVLPDILRYNRTKPPFYPNGRRPIEDIYSYRWAWLSYGKIPPTGLKPHADLLTDFPYLGPPNP